MGVCCGPKYPYSGIFEIFSPLSGSQPRAWRLKIDQVIWRMFLFQGIYGSQAFKEKLGSKGWYLSIIYFFHVESQNASGKWINLDHSISGSDWTVVRGLRDSTGGGPTGLLGCVLPRSLQYKMTSSVIANKDMTNDVHLEPEALVKVKLEAMELVSTFHDLHLPFLVMTYTGSAFYFTPIYILNYDVTLTLTSMLMKWSLVVFRPRPLADDMTICLHS